MTDFIALVKSDLVINENISKVLFHIQFPETPFLWPLLESELQIISSFIENR